MLLFLSIAFLFIAPLINLLSERRSFVATSLHGFVFVAISALIFVDILPALITQAGPIIIVLMLAGLVIPVLTEYALHNAKLVHKVIIVVALLGLFLHTLVDGIALSHQHSDAHLAFAVALHRIPVGLLIWWYIQPNFGRLAAFAVLAIIAGGTVIGYSFSKDVYSALQANEVAYFQALVVGMLVHVIFHQHNDHKADKSKLMSKRKAEGIGNLIGLVSVFYLFSSAHHHHHAPVKMLDSHSHAHANDFLPILTTVSLSLAPYILVLLITLITIRFFRSTNQQITTRVIDSSRDIFDTYGSWMILSVMLITALLYVAELMHWHGLFDLHSQPNGWVNIASVGVITLFFFHAIYRNGLTLILSRLTFGVINKHNSNSKHQH